MNSCLACEHNLTITAQWQPPHFLGRSGPLGTLNGQTSGQQFENSKHFLHQNTPASIYQNESTKQVESTKPDTVLFRRRRLLAGRLARPTRCVRHRQWQLPGRQPLAIAPARGLSRRRRRRRRRRWRRGDSSCSSCSSGCSSSWSGRTSRSRRTRRQRDCSPPHSSDSCRRSLVTIVAHRMPNRSHIRKSRTDKSKQPYHLTTARTIFTK